MPPGPPRKSVNSWGLNITAPDGNPLSIVMTGYAGAPAIYSNQAGGTGASPAAIGATQILLGLRAGGHDGSAWSNNQAMVLFRTINGWSRTDHSANLLIYTTAAGATAAALRATFDVNFTITGAGYQPGGGSWTATSDARFKRDVEPTGVGSTRSAACGRSISAITASPVMIRIGSTAGWPPRRLPRSCPRWCTPCRSGCARTIPR